MGTANNFNRGREDNRENDTVFSKTVTAGKRIYYLDVKQNRQEELFLVITERTKVEEENISTTYFEKHKIFLFKEDFGKFMNALAESISYIKENNTVNFVPRAE
jgi:hypothetical protein